MLKYLMSTCVTVSASQISSAPDGQSLSDKPVPVSASKQLTVHNINNSISLCARVS